jgi:hypothetical protein
MTNVQAGTGDKRINHESAKVRKHEKEKISCFFYFVISGLQKGFAEADYNTGYEDMN